ncbi:MAG: hypothetical protein OER86_10750, partial [Phycisphaerae bacterium]|nr:hypothetical protein [Phycisphaerae bacterium]
MALPLLTPRRLIVFGLVFLVVLAFLPARFCVYGPPLSSAVLATLKPVSVPAKYLGDSVRRRLDLPRVSDRVDTLNSLLEQREQEVLRLKMQVAELRRELEAVTEIRRLFPSYEHVIASVIARSADPASSLLQIDRGSAHRLEAGMPAVAGPHLVGRIRQVGPQGRS